MIYKFTSRAEKALELANDLAMELGHNYIGTEHLLYGLAKEGTGVKAGGPVRDVLELAGVKDVLSKSLGSSTKINAARATLRALKDQKSPNHVAYLRDKKVEELR